MLKFEKIFLSILKEQQDDDDDLDFIDHDDQDDEFDHDDEVGDEMGADEPYDIEEPNDVESPEIPVPSTKPETPKKLTRTEMIKERWRNENPGISEQQISDAIAFFNERKDRLKPYKPYGTIDPRTGRYYVNLPEITSMAQRFPDMIPILSDEPKLKDLMNYNWEQISFYQSRIIRQAMEFDDESWVPGDFTEDQRIEMALERWKKPFNRIFDDGTLTVYKIESQSEAIALGAIQHSLWRKYNIDAMSEDKRKRLSFEKDGVFYDAGIHPDILQSIKRGPRSYRFAFGPWCVARPKDGNYGGNLWTNYRPENAFYFVLDRSKPEWDEWYITAIIIQSNGKIEYSGLPNDQKNTTWEKIVSEYPALTNHRDLFKYFGTTSRERKELTLDEISMKKTDPNYFGNMTPEIQATYINNNRFISSKDAFLTLEFVNRKLYVDKARNNTNQDYKRRFICTDPIDEPFAILDILKREKVKIPGHGPGTGDMNLYSYLDNFILKTREGVINGVLSIKSSLLGSKYKRTFIDEEKEYALCSLRETSGKINRNPKVGVININNLDTIKDVGGYIPTRIQTFIFSEVDENGIKRWGIPQILQRYSRSTQPIGTNEKVFVDIPMNDYFYFFFSKNALKPSSSEYFKGQYFGKEDGDKFLQEINQKIQEGKAKKI